MLRLRPGVGGLGTSGNLAKSTINPLFSFLDDVRFRLLLCFKSVLGPGDQDVAKSNVLVKLDVRSYVPKARFRIEISFHKNQMVAVPCGHVSPFVFLFVRNNFYLQYGLLVNCRKESFLQDTKKDGGKFKARWLPQPT